MVMPGKQKNKKTKMKDVTFKKVILTKYYIVYLIFNVCNKIQQQNRY